MYLQLRMRLLGNSISCRIQNTEECEMRICCSYDATGTCTRTAGLQSQTHTDGQSATIALQTSVQHSARRRNLVRAQQRHKLRRSQREQSISSSGKIGHRCAGVSGHWMEKLFTSDNVCIVQRGDVCLHSQNRSLQIAHLRVETGLKLAHLRVETSLKLAHLRVETGLQLAHLTLERDGPSWGRVW